MKHALTLALVACAACNNSQGGSPAAATTATNTSAQAPQVEAKKAEPAPAPKAAFVQKGIKPGKIAVGYMVDLSDDSQCAVVTEAPEKADDFKKNATELAKMMKGRIIDKCPTDQVVGSCSVGFGMISNYSGPKWTAATAQKDCEAHKGTTWIP